MVLRMAFKRTKTIETIDMSTWLTRDELLQRYAKRADKADGLIARKVSASIVPDHPDFPGDKDMQLYLVLQGIVPGPKGQRSILSLC